MTFWPNQRVVVLGGAALIGSHLVEALLAANCRSVLVVDNFSSGRALNLPQPSAVPDFHYYYADLRDPAAAHLAVKDCDVCFYLASQHGGRGFVSGHKAALYDNLGLDASVMRACAEQKVGKVILASSACAYPVALQSDIHSDIRLREDMLDYADMKQPDGAYGWQKATAEMMLDAYIEQGGFTGAAARMFTVYGPRIGETHAIGALIARSFIQQNPFEIWGNGRQKRNFTFVKDTVAGLMLLAEHANRGAYNIGVEEVWTPLTTCDLIWDIMGWRPTNLRMLMDKPTGPVNRIADASKIKALGWKPQHTFREGLQATIEWYMNSHNRGDVQDNLERRLTEI